MSLLSNSLLTVPPAGHKIPNSMPAGERKGSEWEGRGGPGIDLLSRVDQTYQRTKRPLKGDSCPPFPLLQTFLSFGTSERKERRERSGLTFTFLMKSSLLYGLLFLLEKISWEGEFTLRSDP